MTFCRVSLALLAEFNLDALKIMTLDKYGPLTKKINSFLKFTYKSLQLVFSLSIIGAEELLTK